MLRRSIFFDFLNRRENGDFDKFIVDSIQDENYIDWNGFALPFNYGDDEFEYAELRNRCAIFDSTPLQKIQIRGSNCGKLLDRMLTRPVGVLIPAAGGIGTARSVARVPRPACWNP